MTQANELDIGPLTWVKGEIDLALGRAAEAITAAEDPAQQAQLQFAQSHLHEVCGALSIIGLDGASHFADTLGKLLAGMASGDLAADDDNRALARRGCSAIANYLDELVAGADDQPLRLFALYREIATACGNGEVTPADMFFPDVGRRLPRRKLPGVSIPSGEAGAERLRGARALLERGLLQWLRSPDDDAGPNTMRDAAVALEAIQASPAFHTLWRVAQAFFDSLAHRDLPASEIRIKQLCAALAKEVRQQASISHMVPERLMRDLLFEIGQAPVRTQTQRQIRELWNLDAWWADPGAIVADIPLGPLLRSLRNEITTAKHDWDAFSSGHGDVLPEFDTRISNIATESGQLGRPSLEQLLAGTAKLSKWLSEDPARFDQTIAIDVATALLLAELSVEGGIADAELSSQAAASLGRFEALMQGQPPPADETSFSAARRAHEWDARLQVTREIASNLGHIEQTLDDFFRNHAKHAPLAQLSTPLRQIDGALALIGGEQAQPLVRSASASIAKLAQSEDEPSEQVLTKLADQISTLGVFVNALQHGNADLNDFLAPGDRNPPAPLAEDIDFASLESAAPQPPPEPVQRVEAPPPTAPSPSTEAEFDAELLAIFIEEAHEVLGAIAEDLRSIQVSGSEEALSGIRRGFHTLKGSGRMVGLGEFGEASWEIEQTLNRWLQLEWPVTPELHHLVSHAHGEFSRWVAQIEGGGSHSFDAAALSGEAQKLRLMESADASSAVELQAAPEETTPSDNAGMRSAADTDIDATEIELEPTADMDVTAAEDEIPRVEPSQGAPAFFDFGDLPSLDLDERSPDEFGTTPPDVQQGTPEQASPDRLPEAPVGEPLDFLLDAEPEPAMDDTPEPVSATTEPVPDTQSLADDDTALKSPQVNIGGTELSRQLFDLYVAESRNHVAALQGGLRTLSSGSAPPSEKLLRTAHTLSGISGTARVAPLQNLARSMEAALDRLREADTPATPDQVDLLRITVDALDAMLAEVARESLPLAVPELEHQLDAIGRAQSVKAEGADLDEQALPELAEPEITASATTQKPADDDTEHAATVHDDLDEQLLPIFLEEADELLANLTDRLRQWEADSTNPEHARLAARQLHTLKGSARMAGAMRLGEQVHRIESRLESGIARQHEPARLIDELTSGLDQAAHTIAELAGQEDTDTSAAGTPQETAVAAQGSAITIDAIGDSSDVVQGGGTLRVRADSLGGFINTAGEIGIARTRIEGELRTLRRSLLDLTENVIRLRNQLREVELQAETQMQSRIAQADSQHGEFDPLEMDRYTRLQELTRMMAESVGDVTTVQQALLRNLDGAEIALHSQARFARDLQQALMQVRMVPFDSLADRLHRVVRQSAKDQGKRVNLDIRGGRIEIDRSVLERMTAAIEHMLRNAVAHGIEPQDVRRAADKGEIGQITLSVSQIGNEIAIDLADDGRGLDYTAIEARARERGLLEADEAVDERRLTNLIFTPGFTTATSVSAIAGRGIGMDVVRAEAAALGGRIDVSATPGQGTRFRIYLPLTLAVTQVLLVRAGHASYAIPSSMITQVLELRADAVERVRADGSAEWQGERYRYRYLPELLGDRRARPEIHRFNWVLLLRAGTEQLAVHVDALRGNQEIVVKAAGPQLLRVVGVSGATVLGDGEIVLILNPVALASRTVAPEEMVDAVLADDALTGAPPLSDQPRQPTVLVVDDSLTVRKITSRLLEREGYRVLTAKDGADALDQLEETLPDVILSDIEMPRMDGFDFVRNLRADDRTSAIPVIMITSRLADKHRDYAQKVGANEYLGKPYDEDELLRLLRRYIDAPTTR